jgi:hypothetical protein
VADEGDSDNTDERRRFRSCVAPFAVAGQISRRERAATPLVDAYGLVSIEHPASALGTHLFYTGPFTAARPTTDGP